MGQTYLGTVSRIVDFGAFVEPEPGVEALAHVSTFAPTGRSGEWSKSITTGMPGTFEILSIDLEKKRIGVAMDEEGSAKASTAARSAQVRPVGPRDGP